MIQIFVGNGSRKPNGNVTLRKPTNGGGAKSASIRQMSMKGLASSVSSAPVRFIAKYV